MLSSSSSYSIIAVLVYLTAISVSVSSWAYHHQDIPVLYCINGDKKIFECSKPDFTDPRNDVIAFGRYANRINSTGWAEWDLTTDPKSPDQIQAYYGGYLEGSIMKRLIHSYWNNTLNGDECSLYSDIIKKSLNSTIERARKYADVDPYWNQVLLTLAQIYGMDDGYYGNGHKRPTIIHGTSNIAALLGDMQPCGTILLNLFIEFDDLKHLAGLKPSEHPQSRCSAIIKVLPNMEDVLVSHTAWTNPSMMLRVLKRYTFNYGSSQAKSVAMSSYPGVVLSIDDYYITSQHMVVLETTIENFNPKLYSLVDVNEMVFEFVRNTVANRLARNGSEWAELFIRHNSGTYNNQFMVVDYKQLERGTRIHPGFLTIVEQLPSIAMAADKTDVLRSQSYWPSYNVPYLKEIYEKAGYPEQVQKHGDFFTYNQTGRALIFARDHHKVTNLTTLYHLMRYNNFKQDPLSRCNCTPPYTAELAIAARDDLNDPNGKYPLWQYGFRPWVALDAKMTNYAMAKDLTIVAVSGPTNEYLPTFSWATTRIQQKHSDQPIEWNFSPIIANWTQTAGFQQFKFNL